MPKIRWASDFLKLYAPVPTRPIPMIKIFACPVEYLVFFVQFALLQSIEAFFIFLISLLENLLNGAAATIKLTAIANISSQSTDKKPCETPRRPQ